MENKKDKQIEKKDRLDEIFEHQYKLQEHLGNIDKIKSSRQMQQQFINQMILAIHEEATEIMRESCYKNPDYMPFGWKKGQLFNKENFKKEIIDLIHFVLNLCIVVDLYPKEIYELYLNKNKENIERKNNGY